MGSEALLLLNGLHKFNSYIFNSYILSYIIFITFSTTYSISKIIVTIQFLLQQTTHEGASFWLTSMESPFRSSAGDLSSKGDSPLTLTKTSVTTIPKASSMNPQVVEPLGTCNLWVRFRCLHVTHRSRSGEPPRRVITDCITKSAALAKPNPWATRFVLHE